jgi:hypothetical protein
VPSAFLLSLALLLAALVAAPAVLAGDGELCAAAIRRVEAGTALPAGLLAAVALSESGRRDPEARRAVAWPWTVNNAGDGRYFASKAEAIAHVEALRRKGERNIDVGCLQINLKYHPEAFDSLEEAFTPGSNVAYGADFLTRLYQETGSWARAVERYHTADVPRGQAYRERVYDRWQDVRLAEAVGPVAPVAPAAPADASPIEPAAGPAIFPQRRTLGTPARNGYLALSPRPARVAVLRPLGQRPVGGVIGRDGRIAGSKLRILSPRHELTRAAADRERPPTTLRRLLPRQPG